MKTIKINEDELRETIKRADGIKRSDVISC